MQSINLLTHQWAENSLSLSRYLTEMTSTNDVAKNEFPTLGMDNAIYLTDHQSQGRGRHDRSWQNMSKGEILLSTWCFKANHTIQHILTPLLGLSLYNSLLQLNDKLPLRLKAPNDIYLNHGKLSGLLVEVSSKGNETFIYIGLGMNVFACPDIDIMTSHLSEETKIETENWFNFCNHFSRQAQNAIRDSQNNSLNEKQCSQILNALNQRLPDEEKYIKVHPNCDLETANNKISWMNL